MITKHTLQNFGEGRKALLLFLCIMMIGLALEAQGQVTIQGDLFQAKAVKAGQKVKFSIVVVNPTEAPVTIRIVMMDYATAGTVDKFLPPLSTPQLLCRWLDLVPPEHLSLAAKSRATVEIPVTVPADATPGSRNALVMVQPETAPPMFKQSGVAIQIRYGIQLVATVQGGDHLLRIIKTEVVKDQFIMDVTNEGTEYGQWHITTELGDKDAHLYPGSTRRLSWKVDQLTPGVHSIRFLFDDGGKQVIPIFIDVRRAVPPPVVLRSESLEQRKARLTPHTHLALRANYGNVRKGLDLTGSFNWRGFNLSAGSQTMIWDGQSFQMYNVSSSVSPVRGLSFSAMRSYWEGRPFTSVGASYMIKSTSLSVSFQPEYKYIVGIVSTTLFNKFQVQFFSNVNYATRGREWNASLTIPIF